MKDTEGMLTNADNRLKAYKQIGGDTEKLEKSFCTQQLSYLVS